MSASVGAVLLTVVNAEATPIRQSVTMTPKRAVTNGIPAATNAPKVTMRTRKAAISPMMSVSGLCSLSGAKAVPPTDEVMPEAGESGGTSAPFRTADRVLSSTATLGTVNWICTSALRPSVLIGSLASPSTGLLTDWTSAMSPRPVIRLSTSVLYGSCVIDACSGAVKTI